MPNLRNRLLDDFDDAEVAQVYMDSHVNYKLAAQIYQTRQARGWTQAQLAEKSGIAQARISKIEAGEFDSLTMATLRKFAMAFDATVRMELQPYSYGIVDVCNLSARSLAIPERTTSLDQLRQGIAISGWFAPEPTIVALPMPSTGPTMVTSTKGVATHMPARLGSIQLPAGRVVT